MGNNCQGKSNLLAKNWLKINSNTYKNSITQQLINQYQVQYQNQQQMISNNDSLMKRVNINHPNVIKIIYFYQNQDKMNCTNRSFRHQIYIQQYQEMLFSYLAKKGKNYNNNEHRQCYCCPIINGFSYLTQKYGFFSMSEKMIYISSQSTWNTNKKKILVKVWLNQHLQQNHAEKIVSEHQMCSQLIQLIKKMCNLGVCSVPQMKNIPNIFHIENLLNYVFDAHNNALNNAKKNQSQARKRVISTMSSFNQLFTKPKQAKQVRILANKQALSSKNRSFSHFQYQNKPMNTIQNVILQTQKKQMINITPKKQYAEQIQAPVIKFKHFNYVGKAYENRKKLKVNFVYNNDNFSTPRPNHNQKIQSINAQIVQPSQFQLINSIKNVQKSPKLLQKYEKPQYLSNTPENMNKIQQKLSNLNYNQSIHQQDDNYSPQFEANDKYFEQMDVNLSKDFNNINEPSTKNATGVQKIQSQIQTQQIIEQQNENHSYDQKDNIQVNRGMIYIAQQHNDNVFQQVLATFKAIYEEKPNYLTKTTDKVLLYPPQLKPSQQYIKNMHEISYNQNDFEQSFNKSSEQSSSKDHKMSFVPNFGKSKDISSPRSLKHDRHTFNFKPNEKQVTVNRNNVPLDAKYDNYLKKFNKMVGNNSNSSSKRPSKNSKQLIISNKQITDHNKKIQSSHQLQFSIHKSLQAGKDITKDKSNTKYSIPHRKQVESLYDQSNNSDQEAMKLRLIQKIQNTEKIMRQNRKKLEKIQLQKQLQKQKYVIKNEMQSLLKNNLFSDESNLIKQKVKHKKATFAQLKAQAAKILQDLNF